MKHPASSTKHPLPVCVTPAKEVAPKECGATWCVLGESPWLELSLAEQPLPTGWVLLQGRLLRKQGSWAAYLHAETADSETGLLTSDLPISRKGTINQLVYLPKGTRRLLLEPMQGEGEFTLEDLTLRPVPQTERVRRMYSRIFGIIYYKPRTKRKRAGLHVRTAVFQLQDAYRIAGNLRDFTPSMPYPQWIDRFDTLTEKDLAAIKRDIRRLSKYPTFYIRVLRSELLEPMATAQTLASLDSQLYAKHVLLTAGSDLPRHENAWLIMLPAGVTLAPHALYWLARAINDETKLRMVYADHDALDANEERCGPVFKPDWSPELLRRTNYIGHACAIRADVACKMPELQADPPPMHALLLRTEELLPRYTIAHVHAPLFHVPQAISKETWEQTSPAAVAAHLARQNILADVTPTDRGHCRVRYPLPDNPPLVSVIIPTRDALDVLKTCVESLLAKTIYPRYELIIVDNQSQETATRRWFQYIAKHPLVQVLRYDAPFNYSAINNHAVERSTGQAVCLLNNDTEVMHAGWLREMMSLLMQPRVGVVGAKLYFTDGRIQHAGDAVGPGGCADHFHSCLAGDDPGYCDRAILTQDLSAVTAACMLTWKHVYSRLGGLDAERLPVAFNDVDYCLRVREAGLRVLWTPHAELYHHESYSRGEDDMTPERLAQSRKEVEYMRERWKRTLQHDPYYNPNLSYAKPDFTLNVAPMGDRPWAR